MDFDQLASSNLDLHCFNTIELIINISGSVLFWKEFIHVCFNKVRYYKLICSLEPVKFSLDMTYKVWPFTCPWAKYKI